MPPKKDTVSSPSVVTDAEPATAETKPVRAARSAPPKVYVETETREIERGGKVVKVTIGKRFESVHREEPPGSGRWLDYQEAVWEEVAG